MSGRHGGRPSPHIGRDAAGELAKKLNLATDPLTEKGEKIMNNMKNEYGSKKGESVFYASRNAGKIHGVDPKG